MRLGFRRLATLCTKTILLGWLLERRRFVVLLLCNIISLGGACRVSGRRVVDVGSRVPAATKLDEDIILGGASHKFGLPYHIEA